MEVSHKITARTKSLDLDFTPLTQNMLSRKAHSDYVKGKIKKMEIKCYIISNLH